MFARKNRLPHFVALITPKVIHHPFFIIRYRENMLDTNRFAINVSKRVDKRAVVRNRLRRVLQYCLVDIKFKEEKHVDMLVIVKKTFITMPTKELSAILQSIFEKEGLV